MSELPDPDESTFRLATGEELVLPGDDRLAGGGPAGHWAASPRPTRPDRPSFRDRRAARRLRARRVRRLVRHVEPWSVLKISLIFYFCLWIITLIAGVILWNMAVSSGTIDNVENFIEELFALDSFEFNGDQIFRAAAIGGLVLVVAGSGFTVLMAVLFNLISDITGGMRITVVEEETARPRPRRTRPRRGVRPTAAPELQPVPPEGMVRVPETAAELEASSGAEPPELEAPRRRSRTAVSTASMFRQLKRTFEPRIERSDQSAEVEDDPPDDAEPGSVPAESEGSVEAGDDPDSESARPDGSEERTGPSDGSEPSDGAPTEVAAAPPDR